MERLVWLVVEGGAPSHPLWTLSPRRFGRETSAFGLRLVAVRGILYAAAENRVVRFTPSRHERLRTIAMLRALVSLPLAVAMRYRVPDR